MLSSCILLHLTKLKMCNTLQARLKESNNKICSGRPEFGKSALASSGLARGGFLGKLPDFKAFVRASHDFKIRRQLRSSLLHSVSCEAMKDEQNMLEIISVDREAIETKTTAVSFRSLLAYRVRVRRWSTSSDWRRWFSWRCTPAAYVGLACVADAISPNRLSCRISSRHEI